jgi:beta-galactosidase
MNMNGDVLKVLTQMRVNQPNKALYVSEYWSAQAWGNQWGAKKQTNSVTHFGQQYEDILLKANASLNVYMFFGGTNFGFMNGANGGRSDKHSISEITSYDYDAPLSESGLFEWSPSFFF